MSKSCYHCMTSGSSSGSLSHVLRAEGEHPQSLETTLKPNSFSPQHYLALLNERLRRKPADCPRVFGQSPMPPLLLRRRSLLPRAFCRRGMGDQSQEFSGLTERRFDNTRGRSRRRAQATVRDDSARKAKSRTPAHGCKLRKANPRDVDRRRNRLLDERRQKVRRWKLEANSRRLFRCV